MLPLNSEIFYDKKIFAENLCRLMKESGERQTDIAKLLKVSKSTVSEYCKGQQMPRMDKIEMLSIHFGVSKSELLESSELTGSTSPKDAQRPERKNVVRIAGRDGSYVEKNLSDEQVAALKTLIDQLPEADDL